MSHPLVRLLVAVGNLLRSPAHDQGYREMPMALHDPRRPVLASLAAALVLAGVSAPAEGVSVTGYGEVFPPDNPWNVDISTLPVDTANSANYVTSIGTSAPLHPDFGTVYAGEPWGIPFDVVPGTQPLVAITFTAYPSESDPGPYPFPPDCPVEGGSQSSNTGDRHALVIDRDHHRLYELDNAWLQTDGSWQANCGAVFDLTSNALRPAGWTSADAAGLPIFAGLARYDEVAAGAIHHALRFTAETTRNTYIYPARHEASTQTATNLPPMGMRVRLKAATDISGLSPQAQIIATCLKHYGMMLADNGGNWFVSGAPDPNWNDADINSLKQLSGSDFEVVDTSMMDPATNTTPPPTPTNVQASGGTNQVTISWQAVTATYLLGYRVFAATSATGPWTELTSGPQSATSGTFTGLGGGQTWYVEVTAEDYATNQSAPSTPVTAAVSGPATTSTGGSATGSGSGSTGLVTTPSAGGGSGGCGLGAALGVVGVAWWIRQRRPRRS